MKPRQQLIPLGRLLVRVALDSRCTKTFPELLKHLRFYTGASSNTIREIREAGLDLLSHDSAVSKDDLFSDEAYQTQHHVPSEELEAMVSYAINDVFSDPQIERAYRPPGRRFHPIIESSSYLKA